MRKTFGKAFLMSLLALSMVAGAAKRPKYNAARREEDPPG